jgi:hypothetical protein
MNFKSVDNRTSDLPEKAQTEASLASKTSEQSNVLSQARKLASSGFKCDWCGKIKPDMRRTGPRICRDCWRLFNEKERSLAMSRKKGKHH